MSDGLVETLGNSRAGTPVDGIIVEQPPKAPRFKNITALINSFLLPFYMYVPETSFEYYKPSVFKLRARLGNYRESIISAIDMALERYNSHLIRSSAVNFLRKNGFVVSDDGAVIYDKNGAPVGEFKSSSPQTVALDAGKYYEVERKLREIGCFVYPRNQK